MKTLRQWLTAALALGLGLTTVIALNQPTPTVPLVDLPDDPLYLNGSKAKANLTLALSVESPTVGTTFWGSFNAGQTYLGYFDPMYCYVNHNAGNDGEYFVASSKKAGIDASCGASAAFDGNFLNWATSSAIDILRYGLTGGNRVIDEATGEGRTVLERAYLSDSFYNGAYSVFFPLKRLPQDQIGLRTPFSGRNLGNGLYIRNCRNRAYFATADDANQTPLFVAMNADGVRQPITSAPVVASGLNGKRIVVVGTGKYLELVDTSLPVRPGASLYALPEGDAPISGRSALSVATISSATGTIATSNFRPDGSNGWYVDFNATIGERQTSAMRLDRGLLTVSTLFPSGGACGEGGGRKYDVDVLTGIGRFSESDVGLLGGTFDLQNASVTVSKSDSSGGRLITYTLSTGLQGAKGVSHDPDGRTITLRGGRLAWREVNRITP